MKLPRLKLVVIFGLLAGLIPYSPVKANSLPTSFTVTGSGWGHGLGLSQYGARGMAIEGNNSEQILANYFPGTTYADFDSVAGTGANAGLIRASLDNDATYILLKGEDNPIDAGIAEPIQISVDGAEPILIPLNNTLAITQFGTTFSITGPGVSITNAGTAKVTWNNTTTIVAINSGDPRNSESEILGNCIVGSSCPNRYKYGFIDLFISKAGADSAQDLHAVNTLRVNDEYLYGLGEMPSSWSKEALKAQVVAARSYAIVKILDNPNSTRIDDCQCQIYTTSTHQVFSGFNKEVSASGSNWVSAVNETISGNIGKVISYNGSVISTYYSSSTGGRTQPIHEVWGGSQIPYLLGSEDRWSLLPAVGNPYANWSVTISHDILVARLKAQDTRVTDIASLSISGTYASGSVSQLTIVSSTGTTLVLNISPSSSITSTKIRSIFGTRSSYLTAITANGVVATTPTPTPTVSATPTPTVEVTSPAPVTPAPAAPIPAPAAPIPAPAAPVAAPVAISAAIPTTSTRVRSVTSVRWPSTKIKPGATSVTGRVVPATAGVAVSLQVLRGSSWTTVATDLTGRQGIWKTNWAGVPVGSHRLRVVAASNLNSVATGTRSLTAVGTISISGPTSVNRNAQLTVRGSVSPAANGVPVTVQRRIGSGSWRNLGTVTTNGSGSWSLTVNAGPTKAASQFRVVTSDGRVGKVTSRTIRTSVR